MIATLFKYKKVNEVALVLSGSKSESNRLLILQALYPGIEIENLSTSDDTRVLQLALKSTNEMIDIHHAGTAMRFLTAYLAATTKQNVTLTGSSRMQERPIGILVDALTDLGASIEYLGAEGYPPLRISPSKLKNEVTIEANVSSQYISALLLIAPSLEKGCTLKLYGEVTSRPYIKMTLSLLESIGVSYLWTANEIQIKPLVHFLHSCLTVEADWSAASYFYSCVALSKNLATVISSFRENSLQGDAALVSLYRELGVSTTRIDENTIRLSKSNAKQISGFNADLANTPDIAQTIAVTCFGLGISCELTGLHTLKIKETDRLLALQNELTKFGAVVRVTANSLQLEAHSLSLENMQDEIIVQTYHDHRMAMAFAPLAQLFSFKIADPMVVTKSYPDFYSDLEKVGIKTDFSEVK